MGLVDSFTSQVLATSMDGYSARQKAITSNLANVETPNYKRRDVQFEGALSQAIHQKRAQASSSKTPAGKSFPPSRSNISLSSGVPLLATHPLHFGLQAESASSLSTFSPPGLADFSVNDGPGLFGGSAPTLGIPIEPTAAETHHYRQDGNGVDVETEMVRLVQNASKFKAITSFQGRLNQQLKQLIQSGGS